MALSNLKALTYLAFGFCLGKIAVVSVTYKPCRHACVSKNDWIGQLLKVLTLVGMLEVTQGAI
jgi:hypothetical protein